MLPRRLVTRVLPPYSQVQWTPTPLDPNMRTALRIATTGWWELKPATSANIEKLCDELRAHRVHICAVTGLPARGLESLLCQASGGQYGFFWVGDYRSDFDCAGALVDNTLRRCTQRLRCPAGTAPRVCVFQVGNHRFQAVYSPWVGKWDSQRHCDFLSSVTANHVALRHSTEADDTYVLDIR